MKRHDGREPEELRQLTITYGIYEYALGSVLFELGNTKILCAVTMQPSVPVFLRGQGQGWLTAEYALLPASTINRTNREISVMRRQGRSVEISRLISRSLRTVIDSAVLGERTLYVDCDVLQADGGTRTASINAAYAALVMAQNRLLDEAIIDRPFLKDTVAAISIGVMNDQAVLLDPDYQEDSACIADINVIMTYAGRLIELQGGAEKEPVSWKVITQAGTLAHSGISRIEKFLTAHPPPNSKIKSSKKEKIALFSLESRQSNKTFT